MSLQNNDWRNFVHSDHLNGLKADEDFQLTAPEGEDSDEDSLGELTTRDAFGSSIEIKLISEVADVMERLDNGGVRWKNIPEKTQENV